MQKVLYRRVMVKESPPGIFLIIFGWVKTALLSALFQMKPCVSLLY
jgi:hypothetical protein